ncbi:hypothetical protein QBE54_08950 [Thermatribacter velox]|uniref:ATP-NAD kinase n=1 Tax=Thermatribacter velox TaxID=3039681 RepID=A0ABZ2Y9L8_9BACT
MKLQSIGLVANPQAGKDIRRLVAYGNVVGNREKTTLIARFLLGLQATVQKEVKVVFMPDPYRLVQSALDSLPRRVPLLSFEEAPMPIFGDATDTVAFTDFAVNEARVDALVTFGGDGTNRLVAKKSALVPIFPVAVGTNNVFPENLDPTLMGMALGFFLAGKVAPDRVLERSKVLRIRRKNCSDVSDLALVDVALASGNFIGARAVWDPRSLKMVAVTQADPTRLGLSSIIARLLSISPQEKRGAYAFLSSCGEKVQAVLAPGLVREVGIEKFGIMEPGEALVIAGESGVLALDGEREILVRPSEELALVLEDTGPMKANARLILNFAQEGSVTHGQEGNHAQTGSYHGRGCN